MAITRRTALGLFVVTLAALPLAGCSYNRGVSQVPKVNFRQS